MARFPHDYVVTSTADATSDVATRADGKPELAVAPPVAFGGTGKHWSPEELLLAALADCFILTFRAIAKPSELAWESIACRATGTLDRNSTSIYFSAFQLDCTLTLADEAHRSRAQELVNQAKKSCFVSNALATPPALNIHIAGPMEEK